MLRVRTSLLKLDLKRRSLYDHADAEIRISTPEDNVGYKVWAALTFLLGQKCNAFPASCRAFPVSCRGQPANYQAFSVRCVRLSI